MKENQKTKRVKPSEVAREWFVVDASDEILGRLAARVAHVLQGKHKPIYSPHWDLGDHVVILNASQVRVSGKKETDKTYYWHTGYPGGIRNESLKKRRARKPDQIIYQAVKGMLPKNRLARQMIKKLHIYPAAEHPHQAQKPKPFYDHAKQKED